MAIPAKHVLTILAVEDLPRATSFYAQGFGWAQVVDEPAYVEFVLPGGMRLGLYERTAFASNVGRAPARIAAGQIAPTELYLHADQIHTSIDRLKSIGARELSPLERRDWGDEAAYFADPDGNVVVLARPLGS